MKKAEKVIETLCVICTVVFLLAVAVMVLGQAVSIIMLNGERQAGKRCRRCRHSACHDPCVYARADVLLSGQSAAQQLHFDQRRSLSCWIC